MSTETTPAIVRAERALVEKWHGTIGAAFHPMRLEEARAALDAALDVEEMARALFESVAENRDWDARSERIREYWRDYARAIRALFLGTTS